MKKIFFVFCFILFSVHFSFSQNADSVAVRFSKIITAEDARKHLTILASDEYEGRETGKEGQKKAARYIAADFKKIGLKAATDSTYLQKFPLTLSMPMEPILKIGNKEFKDLNDFYVFPFGKDRMVTADKIIFLGYGIEDDKYNDYANVDVTDKVIMVLGGEPINSDSVSFITGKKDFSDWTNNYRKKSELAISKGALALVVINANFESNVQYLKNFLETPSLKLNSSEVGKKRIPQVGISINTANEILALSRSEMNVEEIRKKIRTTKKTFSLEIKSSFDLILKTKEDAVTSENVLGMIRGSEFPEEYVFVTAHYDHLGMHDGKIFNGADDDGSGTTGVLEIANAFEKAKEAGFTPKRSIVFMTVAGEEKGLLGSSYYTSHPVFSIEKTVCDLNIDMIGRGDEEHKNDSNFVYIIGSDKISTDLHKINEKANATYTKLKLDYKYNDPQDPNRFYYRSDHYNFAEKGVPIIFYFNGVHEDYHQETDEVQKINFPLLVKRARLVFFTAWEVANRKDRIVSDVKQDK